MTRYSFAQGNFGNYSTILLTDNKTGAELEIALRGATALKYLIPVNGGLFNIFDGFKTQEELENTKGARFWIMAPFANRIREGKYTFNGKEYQLIPVPPRDQVMHGFLANVVYEILKYDITENSIEATLMTKKIREGEFAGYPFSINVYVKFKMEEDKITVTVVGENIGNMPAPFAPGWHSYFKTSERGIENLELTLDADKYILVDNNLIPVDGNDAYGDITTFPHLDFRSSVKNEIRLIKDRKLDNCFAELKVDKDGYSRSSIADVDNSLRISLFQRGGVTLIFTGDTLPDRKRKSIAIEPMKCITNAFNRAECIEAITVLPGESSVFEFGVEIHNL